MQYGGGEGPSANVNPKSMDVKRAGDALGGEANVAAVVPPLILEQQPGKVGADDDGSTEAAHAPPATPAAAPPAVARAVAPRAHLLPAFQSEQSTRLVERGRHGRLPVKRV